MKLAQDLIIIEASGKLRTLYGLLDAIGMRAQCLATLGHLLESPSTLRPLAIERTADGYRETQRVAQRPDVIERLSLAIKSNRGRLLIATDDDEEGHAIAADVAALSRRVRPDVDPLRVRLRELTPDALRVALAAAAPLRADDAAPAVARRITDRVIGAALSRPDEGLVAGRVVAGIAGLARDGAFPTHRLTLELPAADRGRPFTATLLVRGIEHAQTLQTMAASQPPAAVGESLSGAPVAPPTLDDFLMAMGERGRMGVRDAATLLQGLYEAGTINYPRTSGRSYAPESERIIRAWARARGLRGVAETDSWARAAGDSAHEPLRLLDEKALSGLDLARPLGLQPTPRDAALSWISRRMLESVTVVQKELADASNLPDDLRGLSWERQHGPRAPWAASPRATVQELTREQGLLAGLVAAGLGRPSTWVGHVVRATERAIVAPDGALAPGGERVLHAIPVPLRDPATCVAIEQVCRHAQAETLQSAVDKALAMAAGSLSSLGELTESWDVEEPEEPSNRFVA